MGFELRGSVMKLKFRERDRSFRLLEIEDKTIPLELLFIFSVTYSPQFFSLQGHSVMNGFDL